MLRLSTSADVDHDGGEECLPLTTKLPNFGALLVFPIPTKDMMTKALIK